MTVKPRTKPSHKCMPKASVYKLIAGGESITFLIILVVFFGVLGNKMGAANMVNTIMNTAYELLIGTVFYIMAIAVLAGAVAGMMTEFGIVHWPIKYCRH